MLQAEAGEGPQAHPKHAHSDKKERANKLQWQRESYCTNASSRGAHLEELGVHVAQQRQALRREHARVRIAGAGAHQHTGGHLIRVHV